ncbi:MAG TPA: hypothetical protein VLM38_12395 [Blastocatellia bacterium]|nr:hypothetical protein [Blastocatellia bacterium]
MRRTITRLTAFWLVSGVLLAGSATQSETSWAVANAQDRMSVTPTF